MQHDEYALRQFIKPIGIILFRLHLGQATSRTSAVLLFQDPLTCRCRHENQDANRELRFPFDQFLVFTGPPRCTYPSARQGTHQNVSHLGSASIKTGLFNSLTVFESTSHCFITIRPGMVGGCLNQMWFGTISAVLLPESFMHPFSGIACRKEPLTAYSITSMPMTYTVFSTLYGPLERLFHPSRKIFCDYRSQRMPYHWMKPCVVVNMQGPNHVRLASMRFGWET